MYIPSYDKPSNCLTLRVQYRLSLKSARLENAYQQALRKRNALIDEEKYRLLRVNALLLEDDNDELIGQLQRVSTRLDEAETTESHLQDQLREAEHRYEGSQAILRTKSREINSLKVNDVFLWLYLGIL